MIYLDSNILIYPRIDKGEKGNLCRKILEEIEGGDISVTSLLTLDEVVWIVRKNLDYEKAIQYAKDLINSDINFLPVNIEDTIKSFDLMEIGLKSRDALHAATCINHGIFSILTDDPDFKKVKELEVLKPEEFLKRFE